MQVGVVCHDTTGDGVKDDDDARTHVTNRSQG